MIAIGCLGLALACSGCEAKDGAAGSGSGDVDADTDGDTDVDGDSDSDSDGDSDADLCAAAVAKNSYIGCEYYGVTLANPELMSPAAFPCGWAVANDTAQDGEIHVTDGAGVNNDYLVPAGEMIVIDDLPWKEEVRLPGPDMLGFKYTRKVANAAYHIISSVPVTVYQFNPLHYTDGSLFTMTNDASLLLPAHIYRDEYLAVTWSTFKMGLESYDSLGDDPPPPSGLNRPGLLAIVGPAEGAVTVEVTFASHTRESDDGSNEAYPAFAPGQTLTTTVQPYEVLQILSEGELSGECTDEVNCHDDWMCCETPREYDLTGTFVKVTSGPAPAVFAGHVLTFIPYATWAADHLEEQMFPRETWGTRYLCAHNITQHPDEPTMWKVVSGSDDNQISFDPGVHPDVTLDTGEYVVFASQEDFEVEGEKRVAVAQFMVGQQYADPDDPPENGDPSMALGVPVEQYRDSYIFLAPDSFAHNYLTVIHDDDDQPLLDGAPISGDTADVGSGFVRTNFEIEGGIHRIVSGTDDGFAINVYGVGSYTSYMYPGGLNLDEVVVPE
jgi:hypothetical protein